MISVGASIVDITPPAGLAMAGFAVRTQQATHAHDSLTARALVVGETALVCVDVIGVDAALSQRVRARCGLPDSAVTVLATHTHGGPLSMPGRLGGGSDSAYMKQLENGMVEAIERALLAREPARVLGGNGVDPGFSKNRRQAHGPVDSNVPVLRFDNAMGEPIAILTAYACHPVVLGADNLAWTSDYPHFVREALQAEYPGAVAMFVTGCAGDVNTGHSAAASMRTEARPERSFSMARVIGAGIAQSVLRADMAKLCGGLGVAEMREQLSFQQREPEPAATLARRWRDQAASGDLVAQLWADWAQDSMGRNLVPLQTRCTALNWCGAQIVAMPGELFAQSALDVRQILSSDSPVFVLAYADDNPGYMPHRAAYSEGGYEVEEAHRFYGLGATFAPGSAECLVKAGCNAARMAADAAADSTHNKVQATQGSM